MLVTCASISPLLPQHDRAALILTNDMERPIRAAVQWMSDPENATANDRNHGLSFETAVLVFDPLHAAQPAWSEDTTLAFGGQDLNKR